MLQFTGGEAAPFAAEPGALAACVGFGARAAGAGSGPRPRGQRCGLLLFCPVRWPFARAGQHSSNPQGCPLCVRAPALAGWPI